MKKSKKFFIISLIFLIITLIFVATLVFIKIKNNGDDYILFERVFSSGIGALFFYLIYSFSLVSLSLSILSLTKEHLLLHRISLFIKIYFLTILISPFFTSIYYFYSHDSSFFIHNLLTIYFIIMSIIMDFFAIKNHEDNIDSEELLKKYQIIINLDYFLLLITSIAIISLSFIFGDFYIFTTDYLSIIPIYYIPVMSLIFYIFNIHRIKYISSKYFSFIDIINSKFAYYFVSYLSIVRLGYFSFSSHSFYSELKIVRLILFIAFILIVIFNSFFSKIDFSFINAAIIMVLFIFEIVGMSKVVEENSFLYYFLTNLLDYLILIVIALPYYIYKGIYYMRASRKKI